MTPPFCEGRLDLPPLNGNSIASLASGTLLTFLDLDPTPQPFVQACRVGEATRAGVTQSRKRITHPSVWSFAMPVLLSQGLPNYMIRGLTCDACSIKTKPAWSTVADFGGIHRSEAACSATGSIRGILTTSDSVPSGCPGWNACCPPMRRMMIGSTGSCRIRD